MCVTGRHYGRASLAAPNGGPRAPRFHFLFPVRPRRKSTHDLSPARHAGVDTEVDRYQSMIAFARTVALPYLMECRQESTALAYEPQPRRQRISRIGMNCLSDGHIDFPNES
jgi:hypothetical protein